MSDPEEAYYRLSDAIESLDAELDNVRFSALLPAHTDYLIASLADVESARSKLAELILLISSAT